MYEVGGRFCLPVTLLRVMDTRRKYLAFDMETAKLPEGDWRSCRPLGISCAATLLGDSREPILWHGGDRARPADRMSREETAALVRYLSDQVAQGCTAPHLERRRLRPRRPRRGVGVARSCRTLALAHVDMMFHVLCRLGHGVSLDAAARGMGLAGKPEGMNGKLAPALWAEGKREEVLRYVGQDVRTTLDAGAACESCGELPVGRPQRQAQDDAVARGMAGGRGGSWRCRCRIRRGWTSRGRGRGSRGGWTDVRRTSPRRQEPSARDY